MFASAGLAVAAAVILYLAPNLPSVDQLRDVRLQTPLKVFATGGTLIGEFGEQKRTPISYDQIPDSFINAIVSAEDGNFFHHFGVDVPGLLRAGSQIITTGEIQSGGSTITMQVARNFFLTRKQTFTRKFNEILLALEIEHELSKEEILELYANKIYLGKRAYGVQAAANIYYGKGISELSLAQLAMIAGLPKAPSTFNPVNNPDRALLRRDWILGRMKQLGYIDDMTYQEAVREPISASVHGSSVEVSAPYVAEMVRQEMLKRYGEAAYEDGYEVITSIDVSLQKAAAEAVERGLITYDERHGYRGPESKVPQDIVADLEQAHAYLNDIARIADLSPALVLEVGEKNARLLIKGIGEYLLDWENGLKSARAYRTQNWRGPEPDNASDVLAVGDLVRVRPIEDDGWILSQVPAAQAALVAVDPQTGAIRALRGGLDFYYNRFNRITAARRQPGSNLKPFLYAVALENGFTPATTINDAPIVFDDAALEDIWRPENDSGKFYGPTRLREALYFSRNLVSIRILRELGLRTARDGMMRFGFDDENLATNLTLALGSEALPPLKIAAGYTAFANGGYAVTPYFIERIIDRHGDIAYQAQHPRVCVECDVNREAQSMVDGYLPDVSDSGVAAGAADLADEQPYPVAPRVIEPRVHFLIDSILKDVIVKGTGKGAQSLNRTDIAGKTGTTNGPRDAWFSGYSPHLVATAWLGFDDNSLLGNSEFGGTAALPIWTHFMAQALKGKEEIHFQQPSGLVTTRIDPKTGERALADNPAAIFEYFLKENTPTVRTAGDEQDPYAESTSAESIF